MWGLNQGRIKSHIREVSRLYKGLFRVQTTSRPQEVSGPCRILHPEVCRNLNFLGNEHVLRSNQYISPPETDLSFLVTYYIEAASSELFLSLIFLFPFEVPPLL